MFSFFSCSGEERSSIQAAKALNNGTGGNRTTATTENSEDESDSSLDGDIDMLDDIEEEKEIYRTKV